MLLVRQQERGDQLRLLALLAECMGAKGLKGYQPPAENFAELTEDTERQAWEGGSEERLADVLAFAQAAGGEAG